jgi:hypothetical protein
VPILSSMLTCTAAVVAIAFGVRYFVATQFLPYHAVIAGRSWSEVEPGFKAILLGSFKAVGGGFITFGLILFWLLVPLGAHQPWAGWAILTLTITAVGPVLYVAAKLNRSFPSARVPLIPAAAVFVLGMGGAATALFV